MDQGRVAKRRRRRWMSQNNRLLFPNANVWPQASDWLIRDEFTDTVAAGSVNGTAATPGPGTRAVVDTTNNLSVSSGAMTFGTGGNSGVADPFVSDGAVSISQGTALIAKYTSYTTSGFWQIGWRSTSSPGSIDKGGLYFRAGTALWALTGNIDIGLYTSIETKLAVVAGSKPLLIANNKLLWVFDAASPATLYPAAVQITASVAAQPIDYLRCIALPAPFDTDDGLATDTHSGSVAAGTTFTHEANALIEATITTVPSADNIDIVFRQQDASNYWICRIAAGGDISLQEVVAGSPTQRGVAAGVVSNGHRVVVIADGTTIRGYSNNTLRWTYSSATNFATATAGEVDALGTGGAVSDLKTWPRTLSGTAASILNKVSA